MPGVASTLPACGGPTDTHFPKCQVKTMWHDADERTPWLLQEAQDQSLHAERECEVPYPGKGGMGKAVFGNLLQLSRQAGLHEPCHSLCLRPHGVMCLQRLVEGTKPCLPIAIGLWQELESPQSLLQMLHQALQELHRGACCPSDPFVRPANHCSLLLCISSIVTQSHPMAQRVPTRQVLN